MATKKNFRADNTYIISTDSTDNPKLGAKVLSDGRESLFLDYYLGYRIEFNERLGRDVTKKDRKREYLSLYLWQAPRTPQERQQNKETIELAKKIRYERGQQLLEVEEGYRLKKCKDINFLDWMESYYNSYTKSDKRHIKRARLCFIDFLSTSTEFNKFSNRIKPDQITKPMILAFTEYLQNRFYGEGAHSLYSRFKKVIKQAVESDIIRKNPCNGVVIKIDTGTIKKDVLSTEEVIKLYNTHYDGENPNIRRAFIFSCYSGLRWCDIKDLTFGNVDFANGRLKFEQSKTKGHSSKSGVIIPLNDTLYELIGKPSTDSKQELIFPLPSHTMCLKALRHWVKRAEIDKHITWHCARHSFATNVLSSGINIKVVANLLGHSDLSQVDKYVRAIDTQKQEAINSLPKLEF